MAQIDLRSGWPFAAFASQISGETLGIAEPHSPTKPLHFTRSWRSGIRIGQAPASLASIPGATELGLSLPLVPLWPGLLADVGLALLVVLPLPLARRIRQRLRRRAKRCGACGHQLLADQRACPECGSPKAAG